MHRDRWRKAGKGEEVKKKLSLGLPLSRLVPLRCSFVLQPSLTLHVGHHCARQSALHQLSCTSSSCTPTSSCEFPRHCSQSKALGPKFKVALDSPLRTAGTRT
jgi:hypothetical protein